MKKQTFQSIAVFSALVITHALADTAQFKDSPIFSEITQHRSSDFSSFSPEERNEILEEGLVLIGKIKSDLQTASRIPLKDGHTLGFRLAEGTMAGLTVATGIGLSLRVNASNQMAELIQREQEMGNSALRAVKENERINLIKERAITLEKDNLDQMRLKISELMENKFLNDQLNADLVRQKQVIYDLFLAKAKANADFEYDVRQFAKKSKAHKVVEATVSGVSESKVERAELTFKSKRELDKITEQYDSAKADLAQLEARVSPKYDLNQQERLKKRIARSAQEVKSLQFDLRYYNSTANSLEGLAGHHFRYASEQEALLAKFLTKRMQDILGPGRLEAILALGMIAGTFGVADAIVSSDGAIDVTEEQKAEIEALVSTIESEILSLR